MSALADRIKIVLNQAFEGTSCFLVDVKTSTNNGKVQVFIDCDEGLAIERCAKYSRFLENYLETEGLVPEKYNLEMSSPGLTNPLKVFRQYKKNINRFLIVQLNDDKVMEGRLIEVDEQKIVIEQEEKIKKQTESVTINVPFDDIKAAKVKIVF